MNNRQVGTDKEQTAVRYLEDKGIHILAQNFRCRQGEIDIIGRDQEYLVFFEVKYRRNKDCGDALQAVGISKRRQICLVADYYRLTNGIGDTQGVRYDVIGIVGSHITWVKNAFDHIYTRG